MVDLAIPRGKLSKSAQIVFHKIIEHSYDTGYTTLDNTELAEMCERTVGTIEKSITELRQIGFVRCEYGRGLRELHPVFLAKE